MPRNAHLYNSGSITSPELSTSSRCAYCLGDDHSILKLNLAIFDLTTYFLWSQSIRSIAGTYFYPKTAIFQTGQRLFNVGVHAVGSCLFRSTEFFQSALRS